MEILFQTVGWHVLVSAVFLAGVAAICLALLLACSFVCTELRSITANNNGPFSLTVLFGICAGGIFCWQTMAKSGMLPTILSVLGIVAIIALITVVFAIGLSLVRWWRQRHSPEMAEIF